MDNTPGPKTRLVLDGEALGLGWADRKPMDIVCVSGAGMRTRR
jgi:hypothetical protein